MNQQRCINCGKTYIYFQEQPVRWKCRMCGKMNYAEELDTKEAYRSTSPMFGAIISPGVEVQRGDNNPESNEA